MNRAQRTGQKEYSAFLPASTEPVAEEENLLGHWIWVIPSTAKENVSIRLPSGEFSVLHGLTSQAPCNGSSAVGGICCILSPPCAPARTSARAPRIAEILVEGRAKRLIPPTILPACCVQGVWGEVWVRHARRRGPEGPARGGRGDPRYRLMTGPKLSSALRCCMPQEMPGPVRKSRGRIPTPDTRGYWEVPHLVGDHAFSHAADVRFREMFATSPAETRGCF